MSEVHAKYLAGIASLCLCVGLVGCNSSEADHIKWAQDAVGRQLKDPASAQYGKAFVVPATETSDRFSDLQFVCGEVNAKNSYGAYSGSTRYTVLMGKPSGGNAVEVLKVEMEQQPGDPVFTKAWWAPDCKQ